MSPIDGPSEAIGVIERLSASTTVVGVMGEPIAHSLSPLIHNSAFDHLGLDWVCVAFPTKMGAAPDAINGISALGIAGMSVTMPHKEAVIAALDAVSEDARLLNAVNCVVRRGGSLEGLNTDGPGFIAGLRQDFSLDVSGVDCTVIGAGGAARAVILALGRAGARSVSILNRTVDKAAVAAELVDQARVGSAQDIARSSLVVNATSIGMADSGAGSYDTLPCDPSLLGAGQYVVDLIYNPLETRWLEAARRNGAATANGVSMLVGQAAIAFSEWTGEDAPVETMSAALGRHLSGSPQR